MRNKLSILTLALVCGMSLPALADGKDDCTKEPQAKWKSQPDVEAAAKAAGFEVRRSKVNGACYEVYAVKDGKNLELFYDPVELKLMHTVTK